MKKIFILILLAWSSLGWAQKPETLSRVQTAMQSLKADHPRLLLLKGEESLIKKQISNHPEWDNIHQAIIKECDKILAAAPLERIKTGKRLLSVSRECLRRIFQLGYAYRLTGDEKYMKRAEKELLAVCAFSDWNPSHFLDVGEMTMAVAIGYDWLHDVLPESSKATIREAIVKLGIEPSYNPKFGGFVKSDNNWNQVCNAGMIFGVLAIAEHEKELTARVIGRAIESLPIAVVPSYKPDGAYPEGFGYWDYGTTFNVLLLSAVEKALGTDFGLSESPGFLKTAGFYQHLVGPIGMAHNWGDSGLKEGLSPAMFWFADRIKQPSLLLNQKKLMADKSARYVNNRVLPAVLIWGMNTEFDQIKAPEKKVWVGQGPSPVGMMRTSWTDPNAIYVGVKAGSPYVNHAHMDVGSFVLDAQGERWASDFGMQDYNSLETKGVDLWNRKQESQRWQVFRYNNLAHSTLTFDGLLQNVKGYAKIDSWSEDPNNPVIITDISEVYSGQVASAKRGFSIVNGKYTVVRDEVKTLDKPTKMRWNLLTPATVKIIDGKRVELSQNGKKMLLIFDTKSKIEIKTWETKPTHDYDAANPGTAFVGFEAELPANTSAHFNVFFTPVDKVSKVSELSKWKVQ